MVMEKQYGIVCPDYGSPQCDPCWEEWEEKQEFHEHGKDNPPHPSRDMEKKWFRR